METITRRFEIQRENARGGMATVHLANDRLLGREVAVKMLSEERRGLAVDSRYARLLRSAGLELL